MKKLLTILLIPLMAVFLVAGSVGALPFNDRPVSGLTNLGALQSFFDGTLSPYQTSNLGIDAYNDQYSAALYQPANTVLSDAAALLFYEGAGYFNVNAFGIYSATDPSKMLTVFAGTDNAPSTALVSWVGNDVWLGSISGAPDISNFGRDFGYFLYSGDGYLFFSEDDRNPGGLAQMLIYQDSAFDNEWWIGIEDLNRSIGSDSDFEDMIVKVSEVSPVPEPATMLLLGTGLIGLAGIGRKKFLK